MRRSGPDRFGMAEETGTLLNRAIADGVGAGLGIGQAVGAYLRQSRAPHADLERGGHRRRARASP